MLIGVRKNKSIEKKHNQVLGSIKITGIWKKEHDTDFSPTDFLAHLIYECKLPISKRGIIGTLSTYLSILQSISWSILHTSISQAHWKKSQPWIFDKVWYAKSVLGCTHIPKWLPTAGPKGTMLSHLWLCSVVTVPEADEDLFTYVLSPTHPRLIDLLQLKSKFARN